MIHRKLEEIFWNLSFLGLILLSACSKASAETVNSYEIQLRWQPVAGVNHYRIQVAEDPDFTTIIQVQDSREAAWVLHFQPSSSRFLGQIYYRIASVDENANVGEYSPAMPLLLPRIEDERVESQSKLKWGAQLGASLDAGLGGFKQSSADSGLKSVSTESMTFQQRATLKLDLSHFLETAQFEREWSLYFRLSYAEFTKVQDPRPYNQPNDSDYGMNFDLLHWYHFNSPWHFGYGLTLNRTYRWLKTGAESVNSQGAFSAGPVLYFQWQLPSGMGFFPSEIGSAIGMPATGLLTGGQAGINSRFWLEWSLLRVSNTILGVRIEGDADYFWWSTPAQTTLFSWTYWGALVFHL